MQCARAGELEEELQKQKRMLQELKDQLSRAKSQKDEVASKLANLMQELAMFILHFLCTCYVPYSYRGTL